MISNFDKVADYSKCDTLHPSLNSYLAMSKEGSLVYFKSDPVHYNTSLSQLDEGTPVILVEPKSVGGVMFDAGTAFFVVRNSLDKMTVVYYKDGEIGIIRTADLTGAEIVTNLAYAVAKMDHDQVVPEGMSGAKGFINVMEAATRLTSLPVIVDGRQCVALVELKSVKGELATYQASLATILEGEDAQRVISVATFQSSIFNKISTDILETIFM